MKFYSGVHQVVPFSRDTARRIHASPPRERDANRGSTATPAEAGLSSHSSHVAVAESSLRPHGHINRDYFHMCNLPSFIKQSETPLKQQLYSSKLPEKWKLRLAEGSSCRMLANCSLTLLRHSSQLVCAVARRAFKRPTRQYLIREEFGYSLVSKHFHSCCTCSFQSL